MVDRKQRVSLITGGPTNGVQDSSQYGAMRPDDVARLKTLEQENARLKRLLAEKELDNDMLRMVAVSNF